jgi:hypothetical protein
MTFYEWTDRQGNSYKKWLNENKDYHREDGPAYIRIWPNGNTCREEFYIRGLPHRTDGPAVTGYHLYGSIASESFFNYGEFHREDGPSNIRYDPDGSIFYERFDLKGFYLGNDREGFWALWDRLNYKQRQHKNILKLLVRYS